MPTGRELPAASVAAGLDELNDKQVSTLRLFQPGQILSFADIESPGAAQDLREREVLFYASLRYSLTPLGRQLRAELARRENAA